MADSISFTVLENGLDFVLSALEHLRSKPKQRDLKYAILHLQSGVELILKDRLRRKSWELVFAKGQKPDYDLYQSGNFKSVDFWTCIKRLDFDEHEIDKESLRKFKDKRNKLEHFAITDTFEAIKASATQVLDFLINFISSEFENNTLTKDEQELLSRMRNLLPEFQDFVEVRMNDIKDDLLPSNGVLVDCPHCAQTAMIIDDGTTCYFCGYSADGVVAANDYVALLFGIDWRYLASGGEEPIFFCSECGNEALVHKASLDGDLDEAFLCFECGNVWGWEEMAFCGLCGTPTLWKPEFGTPLCGNHPL